MEALVIHLVVGVEMNSGKGTCGPERWCRESAAEFRKNGVLMQRTISNLKIIFTAIIVVLQTQGPKSKCYQKARTGYDFPDTISSRGIVSGISRRLDRTVCTNQDTSTLWLLCFPSYREASPIPQKFRMEMEIERVVTTEELARGAGATEPPELKRCGGIAIVNLQKLLWAIDG